MKDANTAAILDSLYPREIAVWRTASLKSSVRSLFLAIFTRKALSYKQETDVVRQTRVLWSFTYRNIDVWRERKHPQLEGALRATPSAVVLHFRLEQTLTATARLLFLPENVLFPPRPRGTCSWASTGHLVKRSDGDT